MKFSFGQVIAEAIQNQERLQENRRQFNTQMQFNEKDFAAKAKQWLMGFEETTKQNERMYQSQEAEREAAIETRNLTKDQLNLNKALQIEKLASESTPLSAARAQMQRMFPTMEKTDIDDMLKGSSWEAPTEFGFKEPIINTNALEKMMGKVAMAEAANRQSNEVRELAKTTKTALDVTQAAQSRLVKTEGEWYEKMLTNFSRGIQAILPKSMGSTRATVGDITSKAVLFPLATFKLGKYVGQDIVGDSFGGAMGGASTSRQAMFVNDTVAGISRELGPYETLYDKQGGLFSTDAQTAIGGYLTALKQLQASPSLTDEQKLQIDYLLLRVRRLGSNWLIPLETRLQEAQANAFIKSDASIRTKLATQ